MTAAVAEVDGVADALRVLRAASLGAGAERPLGQGQVGFVDLDRGDDDGDRVRRGIEGARGPLRGIPERRRWALEDGRRPEDGDEAGAVRGAAREHDAGVPQGSAKSLDGLGALRPQDVTVAMTGSRSASTTSPARRPVSTLTPVPTGRVRDLDATAGGGVLAVGVMGEQPRRDGPALTVRWCRWKCVTQGGPQAHAEDAGAGALLPPRGWPGRRCRPR